MTASLRPVTAFDGVCLAPGKMWIPYDAPKVTLESVGEGGCPGSPEQEAVGQIEETHLMPATARFCGVAQEDGAQVGIHGICERLQVSVEESPEAGNKEMRVQLPKGNIHTRLPSSPSLRVPGLQVLYAMKLLEDWLKQDGIITGITNNADQYYLLC